MQTKISVWGIITMILLGALCTSFKKETNVQQLYQVITLNDSLMRYADKVMDNNQLWDKDGSDDMAKYLQYHAKIDSLYSAMQ